MNLYVLPHFGGIPLCRVTHRDLEDFQDRLGSISAKRKNNIMVVVKALLNDAKRRGDIPESPADLIRRLKETKPLIDPFSFPEMKAFLDHVYPDYVPYFTTAFFTGMRPNEMLALKWVHVDFVMRTITVREGRVQGIEGPPKTLSSYRDIDMLDPLLAVMRQHRLTSPRDAVYVFTNRHGRLLEVTNLRNRVWYPALQRAKLRKRTMYQTRHTFASLMLSHGEDPLWVARMLGHTSLDMIFKHLREIHPEPDPEGRGQVPRGNERGRGSPCTRDSGNITRGRRNTLREGNLANGIRTRNPHGHRVDTGQKKRGYGHPQPLDLIGSGARI